MSHGLSPPTQEALLFKHISPMFRIRACVVFSSLLRSLKGNRQLRYLFRPHDLIIFVLYASDYPLPGSYVCLGSGFSKHETGSPWPCLEQERDLVFCGSLSYSLELFVRGYVMGSNEEAEWHGVGLAGRIVMFDTINLSS